MDIINTAEWSTNYLYLDSITATCMNPRVLGAFTFHGYQHGSSSVGSVVSMMAGPDADASRAYFASVGAMHAQANTTYSFSGIHVFRCSP